MTAGNLPEERAGRQAAEAGTSPHAPAEATAQAKAAPTVPGDAQGLKEEIERTREQLGETVEQLAANADVKTMARAKTAELAGRAKSTMARATPAVRRVAAKGSSTAREYRAPLALAAVAVITGSLAASEWRKPQAGWHAGHADRWRGC